MKLSAETGDQIHEVTIDRRDGLYVIQVGERTYRVDAHKLEGDFFSILTEGRSYEVSVEPAGDGYHVRHGAASRLVRFSDPGRQARRGRKAADGPETVVTLMPGKVARLLVAEGDEVEADQGVIVVEAMKMENEIATTRAGRVTTIHVEPGQIVVAGSSLMVIE